MKKLIKILIIILLVIGAILLLLVQRIDRKPYQQTSFYKEWKEILQNTEFSLYRDSVKVGWASINITPDSILPMAGYGNRWGKSFERVQDSLFVRAITLETRHKTLTLVAADLLIVPPNLTEQLESKLNQEGVSLDDVHIGATHTHHSIGSWGQKLIGRLFGGKYNPNTEIQLAEKLKAVILASRKNTLPAQLNYVKAVNAENVHNRLKVENGGKDSLVRGLSIERSDKKKALLLTYAAHSTVLPSRLLALSNDYPGQLIQTLQQQGEHDFVMYMAGAVGSMGYKVEGENDSIRMINMGNQVAEKFLKNRVQDDFESDSTALITKWVRVPLPAPTARISLDYALRPWVFNALFGVSQGDIKVTLIGKTLMLGMPADFSGEIMLELEEYAKNKGLNLIITSFNGYYVGYITHDKWYEYDMYETVTMSWNGYQAGQYYTTVAKDLITKVAQTVQDAGL